MDKFLINGPCKIKGSVLISGSKNASLPILAATLLFDKPVIIKNLPRVKDIALDNQVYQITQAIALFPELYRQVINIGIITF